MYFYGVMVFLEDISYMVVIMKIKRVWNVCILPKCVFFGYDWSVELFLNFLSFGQRSKQRSLLKYKIK